MEPFDLLGLELEVGKAPTEGDEQGVMKLGFRQLSDPAYEIEGRFEVREFEGTFEFRGAFEDLPSGRLWQKVCLSLP